MYQLFTFTVVLLLLWAKSLDESPAIFISAMHNMLIWASNFKIWPLLLFTATKKNIDLYVLIQLTDKLYITMFPMRQNID